MELDDLRAEIDRVDREIAALFEKRLAVAEEIAAWKTRHGVPVYDEKRESALFAAAEERTDDPQKKASLRALEEALVRLTRAYENELGKKD